MAPLGWTDGDVDAWASVILSRGDRRLIPLPPTGLNFEFPASLPQSPLVHTTLHGHSVILTSVPISLTETVSIVAFFVKISAFRSLLQLLSGEEDGSLNLP